MAVNVEIKKNKSENNMSVLRRFTRRVQESGVLPKVRSLRYLERPLSETVRKKKKLISLKKREKFEQLVKLGKVTSVQKRRR